MNDSGRYVTGDNNRKSPHHWIQNLVECSHDGGNYLLNNGPGAAGSVPEPSVASLAEVRQRLEKNDCWRPISTFLLLKRESTDLLASPGPGAGSSGDGYSRRLRVRAGPGCPLVSCGFTLGLLSYSYRSRGGMCERLKQAVLKTALPERVTGVRIPLPPPSKFPPD
jgi:hypothetical protein